MLEAITHKCLKEFLINYPSDWEHIYSFTRIISYFMRKKENLLVNSEIFLTEKWYPGLLIVLFLNHEDSLFILSTDKIKSVKSYLPLLKRFGFNFLVDKNQIIFDTHKIILIDKSSLITDVDGFNYRNQNIIFAEIDNFKNDLNKNMKLTLVKKDWLQISNEIIHIYELLRKRFFAKSVAYQEYISLEIDEINFINSIFLKYADRSQKFSRFSKAILSGWAAWVILDHEKFDWCLHIEPIDELYEIKDFLAQNNIIFLSSFRRDNFFQSYAKKHNIKIKSSIKFQSYFTEQKILIYAPSRLMLPNNPLFVKSTVDKCIKFASLSKGSSVFLLNEFNLKMKLATQLASIYGQRVMLENHPRFENQIVFSSYDWWFDNLHKIAAPDQIIIPLLPMPNMEEPLNKFTVEFIRSKSKNWFREFIFPESFQKLDKAISPLRKNAGKLIILDGRINNRSWGREILEMIQPQREINFMLPFD